MSNPLWSNIAARPASSNANTPEAIAARARAKAQTNAQAKANSQVNVNAPIQTTKQTELVRFNTIFPGGPNNNTKAWLNKRRKTKKISSSPNTILRTIQNRSRQNPYKNNPNNTYFPTIQYIEDTTLADPNNPTGTYYIERNTNNEKIRSRIQTATESSKESSYTVTTIDGNYDHNANAMKVALTNIEAIDKKIVPFEIDPANDQILLDIGSLIALTPEDITTFSKVNVTNAAISSNDRQKIESFNKVNLLFHGELCIEIACELIKKTLESLDGKIKILEEELQKINGNYSNVEKAEIISKIKGAIGSFNMMKTNYEHLLQYVIEQPHPELPSKDDCMIWLDEKKTHADIFIRNNEAESERAPTYNNQDDIVEKKLNEVEKSASAVVNNQGNQREAAIKGMLPLPKPFKVKPFTGKVTGKLTVVNNVVISPEEKDQLQEVYDGLTEDTQAAISKLPPKVFYYTLQNYLSNAFGFVRNHLKGGATPLSSKFKRSMKGGVFPLVPAVPLFASAVSSISAYVSLSTVIGIAGNVAISIGALNALSLLPTSEGAKTATQAAVSFPQSEIKDTIQNGTDDLTTAKQQETEVMHESVQEAVEQVHEEILPPGQPSVQTSVKPNSPEKVLQAVTAKRISEAKAVETAAANALTALENNALETAKQDYNAKRAIFNDKGNIFNKARAEWEAKGKPRGEVYKDLQKLDEEQKSAKLSRDTALEYLQELQKSTKTAANARAASAKADEAKASTNAAEALKIAQARSQKAEQDAAALALQMQQTQNAAAAALNQTRIQIAAQKAEGERLALIAAEQAEANRAAAAAAAEAARKASSAAAEKSIANREAARLIADGHAAEKARLAKILRRTAAKETVRKLKEAAKMHIPNIHTNPVFESPEQFTKNMQELTAKRLENTKARASKIKGTNIETDMGNVNTAYYAFQESQNAFAQTYGKVEYKAEELEEFIPSDLVEIWKNYQTQNNVFIMKLLTAHPRLREIIQHQSVYNIVSSIYRKTGAVTTTAKTIINSKSGIEIYEQDQVHAFMLQLADQTIDNVRINIKHVVEAGLLWSTEKRNSISQLEIIGTIKGKTYHVRILPDEIDSYLQPLLIRFIWPSQLLPSVGSIRTEISNLNNLPVSLCGFYRKWGDFMSPNLATLTLREGNVLTQVLHYNKFAVLMYSRTLSQDRFNYLTTVKNTNDNPRIQDAAQQIQKFMIKKLKQHSLLSGVNLVTSIRQQYEPLAKAIFFLDNVREEQEKVTALWETRKKELYEALHKLIETGTTVAGGVADIALEGAKWGELIPHISKVAREAIRDEGTNAVGSILSNAFKLIQNISKQEVIIIMAGLLADDIYNPRENSDNNDGLVKWLFNGLWDKGTIGFKLTLGAFLYGTQAIGSNMIITSIIPEGVPGGSMVSYAAGPLIFKFLKKGMFCISDKLEARKKRIAAAAANAALSNAHASGSAASVPVPGPAPAHASAAAPAPAAWSWIPSIFGRSPAAPPHGQAGSACDKLVRQGGGFRTARKHHKRSHRTYKRYHKKARRTRKRHHKNRRHTR